MVTPFAGVWIEIYNSRKFVTSSGSHPLRGGVD